MFDLFCTRYLDLTFDHNFEIQQVIGLGDDINPLVPEFLFVIYRPVCLLQSVNANRQQIDDVRDLQ